MSTRPFHPDEFERKLGYSFRDRRLLRLAFTHASYGHERRVKTPDNQRLEFLGDAVLQLAITTELFKRLPEAPEGDLTALRARLVNRVQLQQLAQALDLGEYLVLGRGEENSKGRERASILADGMEAVFGAVYSEGGWATAEALILRLLGPAITTAVETSHSSTEVEIANPKGRLQELLQTQGDDPPVYRCIGETGPSHSRTYEVVVEWQGRVLGQGTGGSKKEAEIRAAAVALPGVVAQRVTGFIEDFPEKT